MKFHTATNIGCGFFVFENFIILGTIIAKIKVN